MAVRRRIKPRPPRESDDARRARLLERRAEMFAAQVQALEQRLSWQLQRESTVLEHMTGDELDAYEAILDERVDPGLAFAWMLEPEFPRLSRREFQCLAWATEGKTSWEASGILGISERTVNYYLQSATRKLGCANKQQAIVKALRLGLLT
jgi:DNA-binding CsgD family transcriptional regulator